MPEPVLVIMAAGLGSRYGGLKQLDPVDEGGRFIMDYSIHDAAEAGFRNVVFVIKRENEALFREMIGDRVSKRMSVRYAFQEMTDIPEGFSVPEGRTKPWGTGHAVRAARHLVDGPFAVINADDYYGREAYRILYRELTEGQKEKTPYPFSMVGFRLGNTLAENGSVARGVCIVDENGILTDVHERVRIVGADLVPEECRTEEILEMGAAYEEDGVWTALPLDTVVSMNVWGFSGDMMREIDERFPAFLDAALAERPLKAEYFLPFVVNDLISDGLARVRVVPTPDRWYGMTYREDKEILVKALKELQYTFPS